MSFQRDLAWQYLHLVYESSMASQIARYAVSLSYTDLPEAVIHQAKRCLLDTLGCAIGAYEAPGRPILEQVVDGLGKSDEATLFGSGVRSNAMGASLLNSFLVRFLDYNDLGGGAHNSDSIPSILAVAEREKSTGKDLLLSIVISYELGDRFWGAATVARGQRVLCTDARGGVNVPPALGRLMGLNAEQIAHAVGICASHSNPLRVLDADGEENFMAKNLRFGWVAHDAILSCLMAQKGFTGPLRVIEGDGGFCETAFGNQVDYERMIDFSGWRMLKVRHKFICANITTHGHVMATIQNVKEHDLRPEDIEKIRIRCSVRESRHTTILSKKYARNAESADHSAFFANAIAVVDRNFGPNSFEPEKFTDPVVMDLVERVTIEADPSLSEWAGISEITTKDGRKFTSRVDVPHGTGNDPLTDEELEVKFTEMVSKYYNPTQVREFIDIVWNIDKAEKLDDLLRWMTFAPAAGTMHA